MIITFLRWGAKMNPNKKVIMSLLVLAVFIAGCQSYQGLSGGQPEDNASYIPLEDIIVESNKTVSEETPPDITGEVTAEEKSEEESAENKTEETAEEETTETPVEESKETVKEEEKAEAATIIVQETERVSLQPKGYDPDKDAVAYAFTSPLDTNGEWQTKYGDAGEYRITITASDGELTSSRDILLIVNKKEEAPTIESFSPEEKSLTADENSKIEFSVKAKDLNKDDLTYSWKLDGDKTSETTDYLYNIDYDASGSHTVKVDISDGALTSTNIWSVTVNNVNRKPVLEELSDIKVKEGETVTIAPKAADPDNDALEYSISEPVGNDGVWETTYDDAGTYTITVKVTDGKDESSQDINVTVANVNRPPVIEEIVQKK